MKKQEEQNDAIEVRDVCISYKMLNDITVKDNLFRKKEKKEAFEAIKHVSFSVKKGGILGIVGENGSGKSTLLRAMAGAFSCNSGSIDLKGHSVSLMALGIGFKDSLSGRENIILSGMLLGFTEKEIMDKMQNIIDFAEVGGFVDRPVRIYSSGMHSKLAFSITAIMETDIMLIDEVLSVGDERFQKKSRAKMEELINDKNRTVVIASHNTAMLRDMCDAVLWLHEGEVREYGEPGEVLEHYVTFMRE